MTRELAGKVAIVTGAGRNIGRAIALALADGWRGGRGQRAKQPRRGGSVAKEIEAAGGKAIVHIGDVADAKAVQAMADAATKQFGRIDILVNNAALRREKPFAEMDYAAWREILDVTLDGAFHCVKACLPALRQSGAGTIVNIGGLSAHTGAANRAHVVTAKAGIIGFTRALAHDLAARRHHRELRRPRPDRHAASKGQARTRPSSDAWDHHRRKRAVPRMSRPWCGSCAARPRATSTGRRSTPMAGPISAPDAWPSCRFRRVFGIMPLGEAGI